MKIIAQNSIFENIVAPNCTIEEGILEKADKFKLKSAVGIVVNTKGELLLGKAICKDERNGKWVFPGGGIDDGESTLQASIREVYEETGVSATPWSNILIVHPAKPMVGFCVLKCEADDCTPNEEFEELKWYHPSKLPKDTLSLNLDILRILNTQVK